MSKRFTDTDKYKKHFHRGLPGPYKLLWDYLYHDCDHAGVWHVDFEVAQLFVGKDMPIDENTALELFNAGEDRVIPFADGLKWWLPSCVEFQYGELNPGNRVHASVLSIIEKNGLERAKEGPSKGLSKGLIRPKEGCKDKDKDKYKDKDKDKDEDKGSAEQPYPVPEKKPRAPKEQLADEAWVETLFDLETYTLKDIWAEWEKMKLWIEVNPGRKLSRKFVVNWLNRSPDHEKFRIVDISPEERAEIGRDEARIRIEEEEERNFPGGRPAYLKSKGKI
jgi:hypothetical protein